VKALGTEGWKRSRKVEKKTRGENLQKKEIKIPLSENDRKKRGKNLGIETS